MSSESTNTIQFSNLTSDRSKRRCRNRRHHNGRMNRVHPTSPGVNSRSEQKYHQHYTNPHVAPNQQSSEDSFDISFLLSYARFLTAELAEYELQQQRSEPLTKTRSIELAYQVLMVFHEYPNMNNFHRRIRHLVFQFIDKLMENFGLQFLDNVTQLLIHQSRLKEVKSSDNLNFSTIVDVETSIQKKIIVFIEDNPPEFEAARLARMLIVSLLACNIQPIVIPCNDLDNSHLESLKSRLTYCYSTGSFNSATVDKNRDYRTLLKMGFLASLENTEKQIVIFDVDKRLKEFNDFIAEAECRGHQLLFMRYHSGINKLKFVQKIIEKILSKFHTDDTNIINFTKSLFSNIITNKHYIVEVDPDNGHLEANSPENLTPFIKQKESMFRSAFRFVTDHIPRFSWPMSSQEREMEVLHSIYLGKKNKSNAILPFTWKEQNLQLQSGLFSFSRLFHSSNNKNRNKSNDSICEKQIVEPINLNIFPTFTDQEFHRIFLTPTPNFSQRNETENKRSRLTKQDLDELNQVFTDTLMQSDATFCESGEKFSNMKNVSNDEKNK